MDTAEHSKPYFFVDFEGCNGQGTWNAVAAAVISYPKGKILERFERFVLRPMDAYDQKRRTFWLITHRAAHDWLIRRAQDESLVPQFERELSEFVEAVHAKYKLQVTADNPAYDLKQLDDIMQRNGMDSCLSSPSRASGWHHPICTYSFERAIKAILNGRNLESVHLQIFGHERVIDPEIARQPTHTPWRDVIDTATRFFTALDIIPYLAHSVVI